MTFVCQEVADRRLLQLHDAVFVDTRDAFYLLEVGNGFVDVLVFVNLDSYPAELLVLVEEGAALLLDGPQQGFVAGLLFESDIQCVAYSDASFGPFCACACAAVAFTVTVHNPLLYRALCGCSC